MAKATDTDDEAFVRPFADFLREQSSGSTHEELGEGLHDLIAKVRDTGKPGSLTLTINVEPLKGSPNALVVKDRIKVKLPEYDRPSSLFFHDRHGNLTRQDPNQMAFESLQEVPTPEGVELADPITGEIPGTPKEA